MKKWLVWLPASLLILACGEDDDGGTGSLVLYASGEEAAITGFPVPDEPDLALVDGWSIHFDRFLVSFGNVRLESSDGGKAITGSDAVIVDLTRSLRQEVFRFEDLPARRWDRFSYDIVRAKADARRVGPLDDGDVQEMIDGGLNYLIAGTAEKGGKRIHFTWGLENPTRNHDCIDGVDGKPGIVIRNRSVADYEITLHIDHLFYDSLGDHEGLSMRFDALAAVAEETEDGWVLPFENLAQQSLADLRDENGETLRDQDGKVLVYDPGSVQLDERNLRGYVVAAAKSQGRFNGEGHCANSDL